MEAEPAMSITWGKSASEHKEVTGGGPGVPPATVSRTRLLPATIYNALVLSMSRVHASPRLLLDCIILFAIVITSCRVLAADWTESERQLAQKIAAATGPGTIYLDVINLAAYSKADVETIRRGLASQLSGLGIQLVKSDQAAATVQVSLTQNLQEYVWVAEVRQGSAAPAILIVTSSRPGAPTAAPRSHGLTITRTLLWNQVERILDAAIVEIGGQPGYLLVLDANGVHVARFDRGQWSEQQLLPIPHAKPWPRDLRGRLVLRRDHLFDAYLPGVFCSSGGGASLMLSCRVSEDPWPLATEPLIQSAFFAPNRNFFTGALAPGVQQENSVAPFYSAAPVPRSNYTLWVFAAVDGTLLLVDGMTKQSLAGLGWGSDIAGIRSSCGSGWQVLAASNVDNAADGVRAFEFPDREPVAVSPVVEFAGPVTALWTENSGSGAVAVVHNLATDRYEAYRLSIACSQ